MVCNIYTNIYYQDEEIWVTLGFPIEEFYIPSKIQVKEILERKIEKGCFKKEVVTENETTRKSIRNNNGKEEDLLTLQREIRLIEKSYCVEQFNLIEDFNHKIQTEILDELTLMSLSSFSSPEEINTICDQIRNQCMESAIATNLEADYMRKTLDCTLEHTRQTAKSIVRMQRRKFRTGGADNSYTNTKRISTWDGYLETEDLSSNAKMLKNVGNPNNILRSPSGILNTNIEDGPKGKANSALLDFMSNFFTSSGVKTDTKNSSWKKSDNFYNDKSYRQHFHQFKECIEGNEDQIDLIGEEIIDYKDESEESFDFERDIYCAEDGQMRWPTLEEITKRKPKVIKKRKQISGEVESEREGKCGINIDIDNDNDNDDDDESYESEEEEEDQDEAARIAELESGTLDTNNLTGDDRLEMFRQVLDLFRLEREDNQIDFHEVMIATVLPKIFAAEWETDYERILRSFRLEKHNAETFIICPRRYGKTVSVAMFCAAYMFMIPDATIAIFSTSKRTAGKMMTAIYSFMRDLPFFPHVRFEVKNSECIELYLNGNKREMWCYPGTVAEGVVGLQKMFHVFYESQKEKVSYTMLC